MKLNNKSKFLITSIFITSFLSLVFLNSSKAANYNIICDDNGCTSPGTATFNQTNLAPLDSITKTIEINNNHGETINVDMTATKNANTDDDF